MHKIYKKCISFGIKLIKPAFIASAILIGVKVQGQTLVAGWDFQTTTNGGTAAAVAPGAPTLYTANFGAGTIYMDGSNGSSSWASNEVTGFGGTNNMNVGPGFSTNSTSPSCLGLAAGAGLTANGKSIVFKFNMTGIGSLTVSYATQKTPTGFGTQKWEYSTDGIKWDSLTSISPPATGGFTTQTLPTITALDDSATAYLRLTVSGAGAPTGNNRIDNIQLNTSTILPILLTSFAAQKTNTGNLISWTTENAVNFSHFELERQPEGRNFSPIASLPLHTQGQYTYLDDQPLPAANYYRLKMIDKDGTAVYSKIVAVVNGNKGFVVSSVYPSVTKGNVVVEGFSSANTGFTSSVFNLAGQKVLEQSNTANQSFKQTIDLSGLVQGAYILRLVNGSNQSTYKIIKQ